VHFVCDALVLVFCCHSDTVTRWKPVCSWKEISQDVHRTKEVIFYAEIASILMSDACKITPLLLVQTRTIPAKRMPPIDAVSANFCEYKGVAWSAHRFPTAVNFGFLDRSRYFSFK
jgi:hypothetical protein